MLPKNKPPSQTNNQLVFFFPLWSVSCHMDRRHQQPLFRIIPEILFSVCSSNQFSVFRWQRIFLFLTPLTRQTPVIQQSHNKPVSSAIPTIYPFDSFLLKIVHHFSNTCLLRQTYKTANVFMTTLGFYTMVKNLKLCMLVPLLCTPPRKRQQNNYTEYTLH